MGRRMVEVAAVSTEVEKELIKSALEASGIEVMFQALLSPLTHPGLSLIKVLVPEDQEELAREILSGAMGEGAASLPSDDKESMFENEGTSPRGIEASARRFGHPFLMWDSIAETPEAARRTLASRAAEQAIATGKSLTQRGIERVFLVGCGSSYHAGLSTAYAVYALSNVDAEACDAFEFVTYRLRNVSPKTGVVVFSHSGNTGPVVQALRAARERGAFTVSLTHSPDSPLARDAGAAIVLEGGIEPLYPKTRSYIETVLIGYLLAAGMAAGTGEPAVLAEVGHVPELLERCLTLEEQARRLADKYLDFRKVMIVGAGPNYPTALEVALKFKEAVLVAGEGLEIEEAFHGPVVSLGSDTLVIAISAPGPGHERIGRFVEIAAKMGSAVLSAGPEPFEGEGIDTMRVPAVGLGEAFTGSVLVYPLYMLAYYSALARGNNPDVFRLEELGLGELVKGI
ncbi:MAG TPA: SIS domain-containing protein [Firmicutes bacterium]|nr:SIS domain-containing protein [Candidatus Fermentithermobacillaceae bacterium]